MISTCVRHNERAEKREQITQGVTSRQYKTHGETHGIIQAFTSRFSTLGTAIEVDGSPNLPKTYAAILKTARHIA